MNKKIKKSKKEFDKWTNGADYLFPATWIGEWNSSIIIPIKEGKNDS